MLILRVQSECNMMNNAVFTFSLFVRNTKLTVVSTTINFNGSTFSQEFGTVVENILTFQYRSLNRGRLFST